MSSKKIQFISNIVLPIVVILSTIAIFFLFRGEEAGTLFYFNMIYIIFIEVILLMSVSLFRMNTEDVSPIFGIISGTFSFIYATIGVALVLLYSIFLQKIISVEVYITVLAIITLLWIVLSVFLAEADNSNKGYSDTIKTNAYQLNDFMQDMQSLNMKCREVCKQKGMIFVLKATDVTPLDQLVRKFKSLTPAIFKNPEAETTLIEIKMECQDMIINLGDTSEDTREQMKLEIDAFVNASLTKIDFIRQVSKR